MVRLRRWLILLVTVALAQSRARYSRDEIPHCSLRNIMEGEVRSFDDFKAKMNVLNALQLQMTLHDTACITVKAPNSTVNTALHSIEFLRLEQHHPVISTYKFAIPRVTSSCVCDCAGGSSHCSPEDYQYKTCTSGAICYRTYHPFQNNVGCMGSSKSEVCCQIRIDPYQDWLFTAVQIGQPDTILVLRYRIYEREGGSRWRLAEDGEADKIIKITMNKGGDQFPLSSRHEVQMAVSGSRPAREVSPGMYFVREGTFEVQGGIAINRPDESSLDKLGWLRREEQEGGWGVRKGVTRITQAHHVNVIDCYKQNYTWTLNAEQFVDAIGQKESENFSLGHPLTEDPWIKTATFIDRAVRVDHAEGTSVTITLSTTSRPSVLRHPSQFADFDGVIKLDRESNRYLNITFTDAKGTMIGKIFRQEDAKDEEMTFSVQTDANTLRNRVFIITIPSEIDGRRWVCLHPAGDPQGKRCKWLEFNATAPTRFYVPHPWQTAQGECRGCNERGVDALWQAMDPRSWFDGINSTTELLTMLVEVGIALMLVLLLVVLWSKIIYPLLRCTLFLATPPKSK